MTSAQQQVILWSRNQHFEHLYKDELLRISKEIRRVLVKGRNAVIKAPTYSSVLWNEPIHTTPFTEAKFLALFNDFSKRQKRDYSGCN